MAWHEQTDDAGERDHRDERGRREPDERVDEVIRNDRPRIRRNLTGRHKGMFVRRASRRETVQTILHRAKLLARVPQAIVRAHYELGMPVKELAMLHHTTPLKMWRSLNFFRDTLSDPVFLLAAKFRDRLPYELKHLAEERWIGGWTLRTLAARRHATMHAVRRDLARVRALLLLEAGRQGGAAADGVQRML